MFALLGVGLVTLRRIRPPIFHDVQGAFHDLDTSITKFMPDIPPGFSWREAMEQLKGAGMKADWSRMESSLAEYEAFRYGESEMPEGGKEDVAKLSMEIRRRIVGYRNKR